MPTHSSKVDRSGASGAAGMTRRAVLAAAFAGAGSLAAPVLARAEETPALDAGADAAQTWETSPEFNGSYTAWRGYASTAAAGMLPGAVPLLAPASTEVAWEAELPEQGPAPALALRQVAAATYAYLAAGKRLLKVDIQTGEQVAAAELPAQVAGPGALAFADGVLMVALADATVSVFDEELAFVWRAGALDELAEALGDGEVAAALTSDAASAYALFARKGAAGAKIEVIVASYLLVDGFLLWAKTLPTAEGALGDPALFLTAEGLLVSPGNGALLLLDAGSGELAAGHGAPSLDLSPARVEGRIARVPAAGKDVFAFADSHGEARVLAVTGEGLVLGAAALIAGGSCSPAAPAVAGLQLLFPGADANGAPALHRFELDPQDKALAAKSSVDFSSTAAEGPALAANAAVVGERIADATVFVYAATPDALLVAEYPAADPGSPMIGRLRKDGSSRAGAAASGLLVDRSGMLMGLAPGKNGATALVALEPDQARAAATPVGGSTGLDTLGSTLAGIPLPNGASLGLGAVILLAAFGAYAFIRNGGGKRDRDEGVDEWRAQHGSGAGADGGDKRR